VALHRYAPWGVNEARRGDVQVPPEKLDAAEVWLGLAATPGTYEAGMCTAFGSPAHDLAALGYRLAATEWNWNGWLKREFRQALNFPEGLHYAHAAAIGAAGFLNGMLRQADAVEIATQSMLVGHSWQIAAIRLPDEEKGRPLHRNGQGAVTTLYNHYHGERLLAVNTGGVPMLPQPLRLGAAWPIPSVALLDAVATRSDEVVYVHIVNRSAERDFAVKLDVTALHPADGRIVLHMLCPSPVEALAETRAVMVRQDIPGDLSNGMAAVTVPRATVMVVEVPLERNRQETMQ